MNSDEENDQQQEASKLLTQAFTSKNQQEKSFVEQMLKQCFEIIDIEYSPDNLKRVRRNKRYEGEKIIEDIYLDYKTPNEKLLCSLITEDTFAGIYKGCSGSIHVSKQR